MVALIYGCGILALLAAAFYAWRVIRVPIEASTPAQVELLKEISGAIAEGAMAFLSRRSDYLKCLCVLRHEDRHDG